MNASGGLSSGRSPQTDSPSRLEDLVDVRSVPAVLRSDNGPEFTSDAMADYADTRTGLFYTPPGSPWDNGYVEPFNNLIRDECLNINWFYSLLHTQIEIGDWKTKYNHDRRHSSLGYLAPVDYARHAPINLKPTTRTATGPNEGGGPLGKLAPTEKLGEFSCIVRLSSASSITVV